MEARQPDRLRSVVVAVLLVGAWTSIAAIGAAWGALIAVLGEDWYCERGDSNFGELAWSVMPPGPVCTWTRQQNGFDEVYGPTPVMSIGLIVLIGLGWLAIRSVARARSTWQARKLHPEH